MKVSAKLSHLRIAPRKVRLLADLIRGKKVREAQTVLGFTVKKGSLPVLKLLNQAVNSAVNNFQLEPENLYISKISVDEGPKYKRWRPRSRGQAYEIQKKTSHISLVLDEKIKTKKKAKKAGKTAGIEKTEVVPEKIAKTESAIQAKPKAEKSKPEQEVYKPKTERSAKRIFRRKAF
jgi:large subunit ribosomal protein L22